MESFTVTLTHKSTHKWSERYDAEDSESPLKNLYILKTAFVSPLEGRQLRPETVIVTVTATE